MLRSGVKDYYSREVISTENETSNFRTKVTALEWIFYFAQMATPNFQRSTRICDLPKLQSNNENWNPQIVLLTKLSWAQKNRSCHLREVENLWSDFTPVMRSEVNFILVSWSFETPCYSALTILFVSLILSFRSEFIRTVSKPWPWSHIFTRH